MTLDFFCILLKLSTLLSALLRLLSRQAFVVNADLWLDDEVTERNLVLISSIASTKLPSRPYHTSTSEGLTSWGNDIPHTEETAQDPAL